MQLIYFLLLLNAYGFLIQPLTKKSLKLYDNFNINEQKPSNTWVLLSQAFKDKARSWFIQRAIKTGVPWHDLTDYYEDNQRILNLIKDVSENKYLKYPLYYKQPFHGYEDGNLNWKAAYEVEAATLSISSTYYNTNPFISQDYMRYNVSLNIDNYAIETNNTFYKQSILDAGSSTGISTEYLYKSYPECKSIHGLELSPYFNAVAQFNTKQKNLPIHHIHGNIEDIPFDNDTFSMVVCSFVFHEIPSEVITEILKEYYRVLAPGGILVIMDLDPSNLTNNLILNQFRKWAFEVTEPHIYKYYQYDMLKNIGKTGFKDLKKVKNDPLNCVWLSTK